MTCTLDKLRRFGRIWKRSLALWRRFSQDQEEEEQSNYFCWLYPFNHVQSELRCCADSHARITLSNYTARASFSLFLSSSITFCTLRRRYLSVWITKISAMTTTPRIVIAGVHQPSLLRARFFFALHGQQSIGTELAWHNWPLFWDHVYASKDTRCTQLISARINWRIKPD
jgi:hypothetical protein